MKKTLYILSLFALMVGNLFAQTQPELQLPIVVETKDTVLVTDSVAGKMYEFPMVIVGKTKVLPGTTFASFTTIQGDSLNSDLIGIDKLSKMLMNFYVQHVVYPNDLKRKSMEETLILQLKVDVNGQMVGCDVLDARNEEMKNEILRVSQLLPTIYLFDKNGAPMPGTLELPISFKILKL